MTEQHSFVGDEFEEHNAVLDNWISEVSTLSAPASRRGVHERFVRDCKTLKDDLERTETPSAADLCDFDDRKNSLEVQYTHIMQELN